jgi:hypothetical protein
VRQFTTTRPPRKMPSLKKIAQHWNRDEEDCSCCWRCHVPCRPERAHIIDRSSDGLDGPQNLWLLCGRCHANQPIFEAGDEWHATAYMLGVDDATRWSVCTMRLVNAARPPDLFADTCSCQGAISRDELDNARRWTESDFALAFSGEARAAANASCRRFIDECLVCDKRLKGSTL